MTPTLSKAHIQNETLAAFTGGIARPDTPPLYRLGLLAAALALVLLPLVYVAITAAAGWLVYFQATQGRFIGSGIFALITYLAPLVAGAIVVFFMIKPLFARPQKPAEAVSLSEEQEPLLHAFVERICGIVGAPRPREIHVDCQVNASAGFRRGLLSLAGQDLVLTIGLPLAAGLRADQLAGVLAHEFGHFSQGAGMRLSFVVRTINAWFHRVVNERDEWDAKLDRWSHDADWRIAVMLWLAKLGIWASRKILRALMMAGHAISSFLLRQMEFDADLYECRLAGSKTFSETSLELELLNIASRRALRQIGGLWQEGRLVDDIPAMTAAARRDLSDAEIEQVEGALKEIETNRFDTHPATKDRIAAALRENALGVFQSSRPAADLFVDFESLSKQVTAKHYREDLGLEYEESAVLAVDAALALSVDEVASSAAFELVTFNCVRLSHAVRLAEPRGISREEALRDLAEARERMEKCHEDWAVQLQALDDAWARRSELHQADGLLRAGFKIKADDFGVSRSSPEVVDEELRQADASVTAQGGAAEEARLAVTQRLAAAQELALLGSAEQTLEKWRSLRAALNALADASVHSQAMSADLIGLSAIYRNSAGRESDEDLVAAAKNMSASLSGRMQILARKLHGIPYPFSHANAGMLLGQYVDPSPGQDIHSRADETSERVLSLYFRVLTEICVLALAVETEASARNGSRRGAAQVMLAPPSNRNIQGPDA